MAAKSSTFNISVKLLTQQFNKGIKDIQKQIRGVGNFIKGAFALGSVVSFGKQMVQTAMDFEDGMARVRAVSNASVKELDMMTEKARELGATTRYTATEAAGALENLTRNGMSASQATQALAGTLQLAQANAIGLAEAADMVTNVLNVFGLEADEVERVNDVLSATSANSATNVSLLAEALYGVGPIAKIMGKSIEETSAALGVLANSGIKGSEAGKALGAMYQRLASQSPQAQAALAQFGLSLDESTLKTQTFEETLNTLAMSGIGNSIEALSKVFGKNYARAIATLINSTEDFNYMLLKTQNAAGTTSRMFKQGVGTTRAAIDTLNSTYQAFLDKLGTKTSGVVNGVINLLTGLIRNFDTLGGTLVNMGSVIIPLVTKRVVTLFTSFEVGATKAAAKVATLKVLMGDWITLLATAATWIGTYLYTNMSKFNKETEKFEIELKKVQTQADSTRGVVERLVAKLGTTTDKTTLMGVVDELTEMFPEFAKVIKDAADEAGRTGKYDDLKSKLEDIIRLQALMRGNALIESRYQQVIEEAGKRMRNASMREKEAAGLGELQKWFDAHDIAKAMQESIYGEIANMRIQGFSDSEISRFVARQTQHGIESIGHFNQNYINGLAELVGEGRSLQQSLVEGKEDYKKTKEELKAANDAIVQAEEDAAKKIEEENERKEDAKRKKKSQEERLQDIDDNYTKTVGKLYNDLALHFITLEQFAEKWAQAVKTAYDSWEQETGEWGKKNPYGERREYVNRREKNADMVKPITGTVLQGKAEPTKKETIKTSEHPIVDLPEIDYFDFDDFLDSASEAIQMSDNFVYALQSIRNAFDTLADSDADWLDKLAAILQIMQSTIGAVKALDTVLTALGITQSAEVAAEVASAEVKKDIKRGEVTANSASAISGAASAMASIPYVGPILATAAATEMAGLLATLVPKFAKGGIIQGGSKYGDKLLARVNAGEAVLTQQQQKNFMDLANGKYNGGGQVQFYISGRDLVGVLRNNNAANSKISGAKGL